MPVLTSAAAGEAWGLNTKSSEDVPKGNTSYRAEQSPWKTKMCSVCSVRSEDHCFAMESHLYSELGINSKPYARACPRLGSGNPMGQRDL